MSHTIYGNRTQNGIYVSDMVNDSNDTIYPFDPERYFIRLTGWFASDEMKDEQKPAMAVFSNDHPFEAIYAKKLAGKFSDYYNKNAVTEENKKFQQALEETKNEFADFSEISKIEKEISPDFENDFEATDNQGYEMDGTCLYKGKKFVVHVSFWDRYPSWERAVAANIYEQIKKDCHI